MTNPSTLSSELASATALREAAVMEHSPDLAGLGTAEDQLQQAVRSCDAAGLSSLLHDELVAVAPDGRLVGKQEDVGGYASGAFAVDTFEQLERRALVVGGTGVTFVVAKVRGRLAQTQFDVTMRYTRTWTYAGRWQVLAAHLTQLSP